MIKVENHFNGVEEVLEQRRIEKMVGPRSNGVKTQQAISGANGRRQSFPASAPPSAPGSNAGSDVGSGFDFTKEDVEALLNERIKIRNKFNYKVKNCSILTFRLKFKFLVEFCLLFFFWAGFMFSVLGLIGVFFGCFC